MDNFNNLPDERRNYIRSLCFVLQATINELFPDKVLVIDYSLPSGLYCEVRETRLSEDGRPLVHHLGWQDLAKIKERMTAIVEADYPITKEVVHYEKAKSIFLANNQVEKAKLLETRGREMVEIYWLNGHADTFYGDLVSSTGVLKTFEIIDFKEGFCLQYPLRMGTAELIPIKNQGKIAKALKKHSDWCSILGITSVGTLNKAVMENRIVDIINLAETRHSVGYADIATKIYEQRNTTKIVFIAGPSSSGKTSTSLRLALHLKVLGLNPKVIELDNYFVDRSRTPKDENGEYDFESLYAMDLELLGQQLNDLLEGKTVEVPRFDFKLGQGFFEGNYMTLEEKDILIMEGIHALNPAMIPGVDPSKVFRLYASALTSLSLDENNNISTADSRLLRRMVRDNRTRGINPEQTILRWDSVRRGEDKNIFPFQENADAVFNSALIFELPLLKYYAEPLLKRISPTSPAYAEAVRLLKFLDYIVPLSPDEIAAIPPTSILREFIGGQTLERK
jgi:uridine kinase